MRVLTNLTPTMALIITGMLMLATYVLVGFNVIDSKSADTLIAFLLGGGGGAAIASANKGTI
jgi:hypothetical protein